MREITEEYKDRISRLQKIFIENTSTLSDKLRAEVYSRFNNVRYFLLDCNDLNYFGDSLAYFNGKDGNIYIMDKKYRVAEKNISKEEADRLLATMPNLITDSVLMHEIIHSGSCKKDLNKYGKYPAVGYHLTKEYYSYGGDTKMIFHENKALNEGATEFYSQTFLKQETTNYIFYTQIYKILSNVCGYENLKEAYFSNDIQKFKNIVRESFCLKDDALTEKLLRQMDVVFTASENTHTILNYIPLVKNCFETLAKMQVNKIREEVKRNSKSNTDFVENFKREFDKFDIQKFIMEDSCFIARLWLDSISKQIDKNLLLSEIPTTKHTERLLKNTAADIVDSIKFKDAKRLIYYKNHLGDHKLDMLRLLNQSLYTTHRGYSCDNSIAIANYLKLLGDKNKKIDFKDFKQEDKYEFMTIVLFSPYETLEKPYQYFYLNDIQDYLNNQEDTYTAFLNNLDAMEYIVPIVPNLNDGIKSNGDFMMQYNIAKNDREMKEEL